jgi:hypothetical protein
MLFEILNRFSRFFLILDWSSAVSFSSSARSSRDPLRSEWAGLLSGLANNLLLLLVLFSKLSKVTNCFFEEVLFCPRNSNSLI